MAKVKRSIENAPETKAGLVLARLDQIEKWFQDGFKTHEVLAKLKGEGIELADSNLRRLLRRYGKSERQVRRALAGVVPESVPVERAPKGEQAEITKPRQAVGETAVAQDLQEKLKNRSKRYVEKVREDKDMI